MSVHNISNTIANALSAAGLTTRSGTARNVLDTIRNALARAGLSQRGERTTPAPDADVIDVEVVDLGARPVAEPSVVEPVVEKRASSAQGGAFLSFDHASELGSRAYKLYVPAAYAAGSAPMPLVVMLHGCKQNPDDFARGTRLNELAEEQGVLVAYPAQTPKANGANCWNWFEPQHQRRDGAEPSIIVGIVRQIARDYRVDERRVFVAGLSAGAAMAVILADAYPDVFAAVGAHSGVPEGAAHDVPSAFAAMRGAVLPAGRTASRAVPTIVFHGDRDATVASKNGDVIAERAVARLEAERGTLTREEQQCPANGRDCTRVAHVDGDGRAVAEHWTVHGGGHTWFGGSSAGSYADPQGPDASREMLRFFLSQSAGGRAVPPVAGA